MVDLLPIPPGLGLPAACDAALEDPAAGEFFASRLWYDTLLRHATASGEGAVCLRSGTVLLPLLRRGGRLTNLAGPYTLDWRPLAAPGADDAALRQAGRALAGWLRLRPPLLLDAIDPDLPALVPWLSGLRLGGVLPLRFDHFLNWHEEFASDCSWQAYLAARPPELRTTIRRRTARCLREMDFACIDAPGPALETGIAAYEAVRAASWKPEEPFPDFDGALMRAAAAAGLLRLGLLTRRTDGAPIAAQYWVLDRMQAGGLRRAAVLKLSHVEAEKQASPGTALTALMIERLLDGDGVRALDFGRGDDPYKRLWVGTPRRRIGLVLASPLHPAGLGAIARQGVGNALRQAVGAMRRRLRGGKDDA